MKITDQLIKDRPNLWNQFVWGSYIDGKHTYTVGQRAGVRVTITVVAGRAEGVILGQNGSWRLPPAMARLLLDRVNSTHDVVLSA